MRALDLIRRPVVTIRGDATISEAAQLMNDKVVGALVVVDGDRPVGIVTDRDIVLRAVARHLPWDSRIDSVMTTDLVTLDASAHPRASIALFRRHAIRRLPLVDAGRVVGMLTVDDLLIDLTADLADIVRPVTGETIFGHREEPAPVPST